MLSFGLQWGERCAVACLGMLVVLLVGCGPSGPTRIPVTGQISFDGQPLSKGTITFIPTGEGTAASGEIIDGKFAIAQEVGPSPGRSRVEVLSYQETGRQVPGMVPGTMEPEIKQVIPDQYNTRTKLEQELVVDQPVSLELTSK
jgi:hypothetical protein